MRNVGTTTLVSLLNAAGAAAKFNLFRKKTGSFLCPNLIVRLRTLFQDFHNPSKDQLMLVAKNSAPFAIALRSFLSLPLAMAPGYLLAAQTNEVNIVSTKTHASPTNRPLLSLRGKAYDQAIEQMKAAVCGPQPGLYGTIADPIRVAAPLEPSRRTAHRICRVLDAPPRARP